MSELEAKRIREFNKLINTTAHEMAGISPKVNTTNITAPVALKKESASTAQAFNSTDIGRIVCEINNLRGEVQDLKNWKDPRNTPARLETLSTAVEDLTRKVSLIQQELANIHGLLINKQDVQATTPVSDPEVVSQEIMKETVLKDTPRRGRPRKDA